jgi:hypothetical protein
MSIYSNEARFGDYTPTDFGWGARDPEQTPSLLAEFLFRGVSFGLMHVDVHGLFTALLTELVPLIPGGLVAGQCGCYNPNSKTVGGDRSFHTYGIAIDVNWGSNPMYAKSIPTGPHTLPAATSGIAKNWGCEWGGDWTYPQDWMHIEVHLTPDEARAVTTSTPPEVDMTPEQAAQLANVESMLRTGGPAGTAWPYGFTAVQAVLSATQQANAALAAQNAALQQALATAGSGQPVDLAAVQAAAEKGAQAALASTSFTVTPSTP